MDKGWVQEEEVGSFGQSVAEFQKGEKRPVEFKQCRILQGVYGQRQEGKFMIRVKIPLGRLDADQLERIAEVTEWFDQGKAHVTTRQAVEIHYVPLESLASAMKELAEAGLTSRESCGNTVRNVTTCWRDGVCPQAAFDVAPSAERLARYFLRHPLTQNLPRKFKIAFSGCQQDCASTMIHDLGFVAQWNEGSNGNAAPFFRVVIGGGLGAAPRLAKVFEERVPPQEIILLTEAILDVFNELGERKDRGRARIKFLIEKLGIEELRRLVRQKQEALKKNQSAVYWKKISNGKVNGKGPSIVQRVKSLLPAAEPRTDGYVSWKQTNVLPQKKKGFYSVAILLPMGDITSAQMRAVVDLSRSLKRETGIRTTIDQELLLVNVHQTELAAVYQELVQHGLATPGKGAIHQVISCPGAETCQVALTRSKTMAKALSHVLFQMYGEVPEDLLGVSIRVSGCPNSCSQHYIGTLGFHGAVSQSHGRLMPCYMLYVGGKSGETTKFGEFVMKLPAKRVPKAVMNLVDWYRADRYHNIKESFPQFLERMGKEMIRQKLESLTVVPPFDQERDLYYDWGAEQPYTAQGRGLGECAGVVK
ncbi:MAG: nitrite/sulfite reductase [Candidatus Omnitrophica bacterium]|nr:nitrite/sulfite reductase [Candidatus Omnitrophota bacterium]